MLWWMSDCRFKTYQEFWPYYVSVHSLRINRILHFTGTLFGVIIVISTLFTGKYWMIALAPVVGYGMSWFGHFVFEKNKPATFQYFWWSIISDFRMAYCMVTGKINDEVKAAKAKFSVMKVMPEKNDYSSSGNNNV